MGYFFFLEKTVKNYCWDLIKNKLDHQSLRRLRATIEIIKKSQNHLTLWNYWIIVRVMTTSLEDFVFIMITMIIMIINMRILFWRFSNREMIRTVVLWKLYLQLKRWLKIYDKKKSEVSDNPQRENARTCKFEMSNTTGVWMREGVSSSRKTKLLIFSAFLGWIPVDSLSPQCPRLDSELY